MTVGLSIFDIFQKLVLPMKSLETSVLECIQHIDRSNNSPRSDCIK